MDGYVFCCKFEELPCTFSWLWRHFCATIPVAFWKDVLDYLIVYMNVNDKQENFRNNSYSILVWFTCNSNIEIGDKLVFCKSWYDKGFNVVQDF